MFPDTHTTMQPETAPSSHTIPQTSISIDTSLSGTENPQSFSIDAWIQGHKKEMETRIAELRKRFEVETPTPIVGPSPTTSTITAEEKTAIRNSVNGMMLIYNVHHESISGLGEILSLTASSTPIRQQAASLDRYIKIYADASAQFTAYAQNAAPQVSDNIREMAGYMNQNAQALKEIQQNAAAGTYAQAPVITFSDASLGIVKSLIAIATKVRELGVPIEKSDPTYNLLRIMGVL